MEPAPQQVQVAQGSNAKPTPNAPNVAASVRQATVASTALQHAQGEVAPPTPIVCLVEALAKADCVSQAAVHPVEQAPASTRKTARQAASLHVLEVAASDLSCAAIGSFLGDILPCPNQMLQWLC